MVRGVLRVLVPAGAFVAAVVLIEAIGQDQTYRMLMRQLEADLRSAAMGR